MAKAYYQINTRMRVDQVQAIKQQASENKRTMQAEIEMIFDEYLAMKKSTKEQQPCNQQ